MTAVLIMFKFLIITITMQVLVIIRNITATRMNRIIGVRVVAPPHPIRKVAGYCRVSISGIATTILGRYRVLGYFQSVGPQFGSSLRPPKQPRTFLELLCTSGPGAEDEA